MELIEITKVIKERFPKKAIDISESLELLKETVSDTMDEVNNVANKTFQDRNFNARDEYNRIITFIFKYEKMIDELIQKLEVDTSTNDIVEEEKEEKKIPNYADYLVDSNIEHTLYEDFTHKRPCGFKINDQQTIEVSTWKEVLVKTCEILIAIDEKKFMSFEDMPRMNGKKRKYFSADLNNITDPKLINEKIYVETLMSGNGFRNLLVKLLKEYNFPVNEFKVYLRADYSELNRK